MQKLLNNESGATAIEYALIVALIVIASVAGMSALGSKSSASLTSTTTKVSHCLDAGAC